MRISRISINDFNCIASGVIDFDAMPQVVMIGGRTSSAGASSNGSGKSSVLNAVCWATFGKEMPRARPRGADRVIREGCRSCSVEVVYTLDDGSVFRVRRVRRASGGMVVEIGGKPTSTASGAQDIIDGTLGFSYSLFTRTVLFGGDVSSFCTMTPAERMKAMESLLGIDHYLRASDEAKSAASEISGRIESMDTLAYARATRYESARRDAQDVLSALVSAHVSHSRDMHECEELVRDALLALESAADEYGSVRSEAVSREQEYTEAISAWEASGKALQDRYVEARVSVDEATSRRRRIDADISDVEDEIAEIEGPKRPDTCPTCKRPWPQDGPAPDTSRQHGRLRSLREARETAVRDRKSAGVSLRAAHSDIKAHRAAKPKRSGSGRTVEELLDKVSMAEAELNAAVRRCGVQRAFDFGSDLRDRLNAALLATHAARSDINKGERRRQGLVRDRSVMEFWRDAFGRDGIPARLLSESAPALNYLIHPIADILTRGAYTVTFSTDAGARSNFQINASNIEGGSTHADLSKGESARVDLCVLFAIRQFMQDRACLRFEQVFIDELADGLDEEGVELFSKLMRSGHVGKQVFFISHDSQLQEAADRTIWVEKRGGVSRISAL